MVRKMPRQKPGKSDTVVRTPPEFVRAVKGLLGIHEFDVDLAASHGNALAPEYFTEAEDSLSRSWHDVADKYIRPPWFWLNPPYDDIRPWVEKCVEESAYPNTKIAVLVPASTGANWWADYVDSQADIRLLNGRVTFLDRYGEPIRSPISGKPTPYPKDLALLLYGTGFAGYSVWRWKT